MAVRRVRRVIRKFDPWTVLKVSLIFNLIGALIFVLGSWVMWSVLIQKGVPGKLSDLADSLTITFTPNGEVYFRVVVLLAIIGAILATGIMTLAAVLYNLISDMVGGVEVIVLEETYGPHVTTTTQPRVRPAVHRAATGDDEPASEKEPAAAGASDT